MNPKQPLHPAQHAEHLLITSILDGTYPPGSSLPNERSFAKQIGITRTTLRETLQRLAIKGLVTIHHGKPTTVNDYWKEGGLGLLSSLAEHRKSLPDGFIRYLLELRAVLLPPIARLATAHSPGVFQKYLNRADRLSEEVHAFARYDWDLHILFATHSENPLYLLIFNDFSSVFNIMALDYFSLQKARTSSRDYYLQLLHSIEQKREDTEQIVRSVLEKSIDIWGTASTHNKEIED